jgi:hypothetical protein
MPQMPARSSACPVSRSARERTCLTTAMKDGAGIRALGLGWVLARQPTVLYEMIPVFLINRGNRGHLHVAAHMGEAGPG